MTYLRKKNKEGFNLRLKLESSQEQNQLIYFADGEIDENSVIRKFRRTASDGKSYDTNHYNLSAIIAVGNKVDSPRAVQFRK